MLTILIDGDSYTHSTINVERFKEIVDICKRYNISVGIKISKPNHIALKRSQDVLGDGINGISLLTQGLGELISKNLKDRNRNKPLIVLSMIDRSMDINPNNNSHYIYMDSYITDRVINAIERIASLASDCGKESSSMRVTTVVPTHTIM